MYAAFNLEDIMFDGLSPVSEAELQHGYDLVECASEILLDRFWENGALDGAKLQEEWFPRLKADVFISHSHKDTKEAKKLAVWLKKNFGIDTFIDSVVWGYSNELLKRIDQEFCMTDDKLYYDYEKRNQSTSHVHMMLATALGLMVDACECVFFLNTPNSSSKKERINQTTSPWIYYESVIFNLVRTQIPPRVLSENMRAKAANFSGSLSVKYDLDLSRFPVLKTGDLVKWSEIYSLTGRRAQASGRQAPHPLDYLYENHMPPL